MQLTIKNSAEFEKLLDAVAEEIMHANFYFRLHLDLYDAIDEYVNEYNQANAFWRMVFQSLADAAVLRLCRVYDTHQKSISLPNLLDTIKANLHIFDVEDFRQRLKDNPLVESLAQSARQPDVKQLNEDIQYTSDQNPLIQKLLIWRNNILAHRNAGNVIKGRNVVIDYPFPKSEISGLLENGMAIVNRYSKLFREVSYSSEMVGQDDYKYVLSCLRANSTRPEE